MARYPRTHGQIAELAAKVVSGLEDHPQDFGDIDPSALQAALGQYLAVKSQLDQARARAGILKEDKLRALDALNTVLKGSLRRAEAACFDDPEKLTELSWSAKTPPAAQVPPDQPVEFICTGYGAGEVSFRWKKAKTGGRPTCYILQRRQPQQLAGKDENWQMLDFYYDTEITAKDQPRGVKLEYRVIASSPAGQSLPGNTAAVIL